MYSVSALCSLPACLRVLHMMPGTLVLRLDLGHDGHCALPGVVGAAKATTVAHPERNLNLEQPEEEN